MSDEIKSITAEDVMALVEYIAKNLVDEPDVVKVVMKTGTDAEPKAENIEAADAGANEDEESAEEGQITIELSVAKDDMGKVIGKQGRIAKAIRTVVRAATVKSDVKYRIDIL